MSPFKPLSALVCLLCLALSAFAEKPNDNRTSSTDSRGNGSSSNGQLTREDTPDIGGKTFKEWRTELLNRDPSVRSAAIVAITQFNQKEQAVSDIIGRLQGDPDASPRVKAAIALRWIRPLPSDRLRVIQALGHAIGHDGQAIIRYEAVVSLRYHCPLKGKEERAVIQDILASIGSSTTFELRDVCIDGLMAAGVDPATGPDRNVTDALIRRASALEEPTAQVRLKAIMALGVMGRPQDPKTWERVRYVLKSASTASGLHNKTIRLWSHVSLMALEEKVNEKDLKEIAGYLKEHEAALRVQAVTAFGALEDKSKAYLPDLCDMVLGKKPEKDTTVLMALATALGHLKNNGDHVQRALIRMTEYEEKKWQDVVLAACNSMALLRLSSPEAIEAMENAQKHVALEKHQKELIAKYIEIAKSPAEKTPVKDRAKNLDKIPTPKR